MIRLLIQIHTNYLYQFIMQATNSSNLQQIINDIQLAPSLVKYGNPVLISTGQKK